MDFEIDGIKVRGAETEDEARAFVNDCGPGTYEIAIDRENGFVREFYRKRVGFDRIRRITGYLSSVTRWNEAKTAELHDRVKHQVK